MLRFNKRGQNIAEYAIVIALIITAAIAMQTYIKRSLQGGIKFTVDKLKRDKAGTGQYEPYYIESSSETAVSPYKDTVQTKKNGEIIRVIGEGTKVHKTTRTGYQKMKAPSEAD